MKIALSLLCENPNRKTGLTSLFRSFIENALELDTEVRFLLFCDPSQAVDFHSPRVDIDSRLPANNRMITRLLAEHFRIGSAAKKAGCDVLVTTGLVPLFAGLPVAMQLFTLHHLSSSNGVSSLRGIYRKLATLHGTNKANLIITNTVFSCRQILAIAPRVANKLLQSYEGIDHSRFFPRSHGEKAQEELNLLRDKYGLTGKYFLWCSNFYPYKQAELLMEAWCGLPTELRKLAPLVMIGGGGWGNSQENSLEIATRHGAVGEVKMLGWVPEQDIAIIFRHATVFVHPSREETFGRSVLEAMASGVPCVVQSIPVMPEVTAGHAMHIDFEEREAATAALEASLTDAAWRDGVREAGIRQASGFSFRKLTAERLNGIYRTLGEEPPPSLSTYPPVFAQAISDLVR